MKRPGRSADQLDQLHDRNRIHEMHAHEAARTVGHRRQTGDRDRRGVAADDRLGLEQRAELLQDAALDFLVLDNALDHQVAIAEQIQSGAHGDAGERGRFVVARDFFVFDPAVEVGADALKRLFQPFVGNIRQTHVVAGNRKDMGDAIAHLAGADDADAFDLGYFAVRLGHETDPSG
jgi:hypothetical protein